MRAPLCLAAVLALCALVSADYSAKAKYGLPFCMCCKRLNNQLPFLSSQNNQSIFKWNYNAAFVPLSATDSALLVRCQNPQGNATGPSMLSLAEFTDPSKFRIDSIVNSSIVFQPEEPWEMYGTEDPRVAYRALDKSYYLLYTAVVVDPTRESQPLRRGVRGNFDFVVRLSLAVAKNPADPKSWKRLGPIFPDCATNCPGNFTQWTKSGSMLIRDGWPGPHHLFFGDSTIYPGLQHATSPDLVHWTVQPGIWLPVRNESYFDSHLVEGGPPPMLMADGNYLYIYNSAKNDPNSSNGLQYNIGWAILNGTDPSQIIQRCNEPILSPVTGWEIGTAPWLGLTPNVVFCEGMTAGALPNTFIIYYGGADSVLGAAEVTISLSS